MMDQLEESLLNLETYEDYLESLISADDLLYLESVKLPRMIAELGYHTAGNTLTRQEFLDKKEAIQELLNPSFKAHQMYSFGVDLQDNLLKELAVREKANRVGSLSTIIFIRQKKASGSEISGYIDFEHSLRKAKIREEGARDWFNIFRGKKMLWPRESDLGYYNWRTGKSFVNNTDNYKALCDPEYGLIFLNRKDRKIIKPDPFSDDVGSDTSRSVIKSPKYTQIVIYDHIIRKRF